MSSLIIAVIVSGAVASICLLLLAIVNQQKRKRMNRMLNRLSEIGSKYNLSFSGQEVLSDYIIGLDGMHRKLVVLQHTNDANPRYFLVDLDDVQSCSLKKKFGRINAGALDKNGLQHYLEEMILQFELKDKHIKEVVFYRHTDNNVYELEALEQRAKDWEALLSKMLRMPGARLASA